MIVDQFELWVRKASDYVQKHKIQQHKENVASQINAEKEVTQQKIDEQLKRHPVAELPKSDKETQKQDETNKNLDIFLQNIKRMKQDFIL